MIRILLSTRLGERRWTQADLSRATGIRAATIKKIQIFAEFLPVFDTLDIDIYHENDILSMDAVAAFMRIKLYLDSFTYAHCNLGDEKTFVESGKIQYWYRSYTEHCYDGGNCDKCTYIDGYVITPESDKYVDDYLARSNFEELKKSKKDSSLRLYEYAGKLPYDDFPVAEANSADGLVLIHHFGMNCSLKIIHLETGY